MDCLELMSQIEEARQQLHRLQSEYDSLLHPEVIQQSVVLDGLINQYNRAKIQNLIN